MPLEGDCCQRRGALPRGSCHPSSPGAAPAYCGSTSICTSTTLGSDCRFATVPPSRTYANERRCSTPETHGNSSFGHIGGSSRPVGSKAWRNGYCGSAYSGSAGVVEAIASIAGPWGLTTINRLRAPRCSLQIERECRFAKAMCRTHWSCSERQFQNGSEHRRADRKVYANYPLQRTDSSRHAFDAAIDAYDLRPQVCLGRKFGLSGGPDGPADSFRVWMRHVGRLLGTGSLFAEAGNGETAARSSRRGRRTSPPFAARCLRIVRRAPRPGRMPRRGLERQRLIRTCSSRRSIDGSSLPMGLTRANLSRSSPRQVAGLVASMASFPPTRMTV